METWTPSDLKSKLDAQKDVFLKLAKPGCGVCKLSKPATDRLEAEFQQLQFGQINVADHPELLELAQTEVVPTFIVFWQGKKTKYEGFKGLEKLRDMVSNAVQ